MDHPAKIYADLLRRLMQRDLYTIRYIRDPITKKVVKVLVRKDKPTASWT